MARLKLGLTQAAFGFVLLVQLFFLVDGSALFPTYWQSQGWATWLPIYITLTFGALALSTFVSGPTGPVSPRGPFGDPFGILPIAVALFLFGFLAALLLFQFPPLRIPLAIPKGDAVPTAAFTIFVVGFTEELLFRWVLLQLLLQFGEVIAIVGSAGVWAIFHFAAYGEQPASLLFIFVMGLGLGGLFLLTRKFGGIGLVWGIHAGWNLGVVGVLSVVH